MRFHAEHRFASPPPAVADVLADADFYRSLDLADVAVPEVLAAASDGTSAVVRLRYEFTGHLDPLVRRLLAGRPLTWLQELRLDRADGTGELELHAEAAPGRLRGRATFQLVADGAGTLRRLDGELVVALVGLGRGVEGRIVPGILARLDREADAVRARLDV
ncbi:MAG: DUF2505 family protein [Actinomycetota bacterium]|nr:DUF2505 family protein [Actinomycetota bacterium]